MASRKRCNFVGRATTFLRKSEQNPNFLATQEGDALARKLGSSDLTYLRDRITEIQQIEEQTRHDAHLRRINAWRSKMKSNEQNRNEWIKRPAQVARPFVTTDGSRLHSKSEVCSAVKTHWTSVWNKAKSLSPLSGEEQWSLLQNHLPAEPQLVVTERPPVQSVIELASHMQGAAGADKWFSQELKHLPFETWITFWDITARWEAAGTAPKILKAIRQINLPKPGKAVNNEIPISQLRPISIYSCFWRLYTSAWARSTVLRSWRQATLDTAIGGGAGQPGCEDLAADALDDFHEHGFSGSLDYSLCFDCVDPRLATRVMQHLGLPCQLCQVLNSVWRSQTRYIQWTDHTDPIPLHSSHGLPQGDAMSPLALATLLHAGLAFVKTQTLDTPGTDKHFIFMDDRSWISSTPEKCLAIMTAWQNWSGQIGLIENHQKTQISAVHPKNFETLQQQSPDPTIVVEHLNLLGTTMVSKRKRKNSAKEAQRLATAIHRARRIGFLPLTRSDKYKAIRSLARPCATYGWIGRKPPKADMEAFDQVTWRACHEPTWAGHWHKKLLLGPTLAAQMGIHQVLRMLRRAGRRSSQPQDFLPSERVAIDWLVEHDWCVLPGRRFGHRTLQYVISPLKPEATSGEIAHQLRESWRSHTWDQFVSSERRHEAENYRNIEYNSYRFEAVRKAIYEAKGPARWLMLGAVISPLDYSKRVQSEDAALCADCGAESNWEHAFWTCQHRTCTFDRPGDELQARYGWPSLHEHDAAILEAMAQQTVRIWDARPRDLNFRGL